MTATPILETLAREFSTSSDSVRNALEMIDAGLSAPFMGRFRRSQVSCMPESQIRRLHRRRQELEELDRRRGTIIRMLERDEVGTGVLETIGKCMDRFELEDLFIPHRRPEPEVQLALDRGLGQLADQLVAAIPKEERPSESAAREGETAAAGESAPAAEGDESKESSGEAAPESASSQSPGVESPAPESPATEVTSTATETAPATPADEAQASAAPAASAPAADTTTVTRAAVAQTSDTTASPAAPEMTVADQGSAATAAQPKPELRVGGLPERAKLTPQLALLCAPFVSPDRGIHTEAEALSGAIRILSDRLGRSPKLRGTIRSMLRKQGVLSVRPNVEESKAGRHRSLLRVRQPLRQVQGHRLLAIRQAQKERILNTVVELDRAKALPRVRSALGKHTHPAYQGVLEMVSEQALDQRLLPMVEADIRLELKERGDAEALRFLTQHLRQILLTPPLGPHPAVGVDVSAKGDWTLAPLDVHGVPTVEAVRIETGEKDAATLGAELAAAVPTDARGLSVGHGKSARNALPRLREAMAAGGVNVFVYIVNEAGLSSYANSQLARSELVGLAVPARMAVSLGRRLQDALPEILKVDPRHLGLGAEQGLVSKANLRRVFTETIESCVAHVGCDINRAPAMILQHMPGLDRESAERIVARRAERPFQSREELRHEGLLSEAQWTSSVAFLRISGSPEPLDATSLHPEQYALVRRVLESAGSSVEEGLRRLGVTKGLRRDDFGAEEATWRDLMREIAHPGRDPRPRLGRPSLLDPNTDPARLTKDRVVEGLVSNVASFGAFVDVGLGQDAMIHISEVSDHYVRDVRELLSIGEVVRAKIIDPSGQRVSLSLKRVPPPERDASRGGRGRRREGGGRQQGQQGRGAGRQQQREPQPNVRAAQSRRDGIGSGQSQRGGGRRGSGPGGGRRGPRDRDRGADRMGREEREELDKLKRSSSSVGYSPFANFFSDQGEPSDPEGKPDAAKPSAKPVAESSGVSSGESSGKPSGKAAEETSQPPVKEPEVDAPVAEAQVVKEKGSATPEAEGEK